MSALIGLGVALAALAFLLTLAWVAGYAWAKRAPAERTALDRELARRERERRRKQPRDW